MINIDCSVSEDCINIYSHGEICIHCGCCRKNLNYRDMIIKQIRYYKEMLNEQYNFDLWDEREFWRKRQEKIIKRNILYYKRKIRNCKKILWCLNTNRYKKTLEDMRNE